MTRLSPARLTPARLAMAALAAAAGSLPLGTRVLAAELPRPSAEDPRVRLVAYVPHQVTVIKVQRGKVTRITLAADEQIDIAVTGLSARCDKDEDEWCIRAEKGGNQIFVRPKDSARHNNMELRTRLATGTRDYSLEFDVLPDTTAAGKAGKSGRPSGSEVFYRVAFEYPHPRAASLNGAAAAAAIALAALDAQGKAGADPVTGQIEDTMPAHERLGFEAPAVRNAQYTMQVLDKGEDAAPSLVFDDGRFTYFEFLGAREIPAIFAYGSDDAPTRVNWHMQGHFVVAERTARKFTLRLGDAVTGVFNEAFDPVGVGTPTGTVSVAVRRQIKQRGEP